MATKLSKKLTLLIIFFNYKNFEFVNIKKSLLSDAAEIVAYCENVTTVIKYIKEERNVTYTHLKLGINGGRGFLKICLSVQSTDLEHNHKTKRPIYKENIRTK